jgi:ribonuclease HI
MNNYPKWGSRPKNSTSEDENSDNRVTGTAVAVAATGLAALAWGVSKWLGSSGPEPKHHEEMRLSLSSSSSSRGIRVQNMNENNISFDHIILESTRKNAGDRNVKWTRPTEGRVKLNTDASVRKQHGHTTGPATAGGVIRKDNGQWIVGFTSKLGVCDSTQAELEALRDGLCLAWERGYRQLDLEVETDSEAVVKLINNLDLKNDRYMKLVNECRDLLACLGTEIGHVYKEGNKCAHALAKIGIHPTKQLEVWKRIPSDHVSDVVKSDMQLSLSPCYVLI